MVSFKYANRGTAAYQIELLGSSVFEHTLKFEREETLIPRSEFDDAMEAISGAAHAAYHSDPSLVTYLQTAGPLEVRCSTSAPVRRVDSACKRWVI